MIVSLIFYKLRCYLKSLKNIWKNILTFFLIFMAWIYGRLFSDIANNLSTGEIDFMSEEKFINLILYSIAFITLIRMIFPSYKTLNQIFPKYYPLSRIQVYFASVLNDFMAPYFFYMLIFILTISFYLNNQGVDFVFSGMMILAASQLLRRHIQNTLDNRLKTFGMSLVSINFC